MVKVGGKIEQLIKNNLIWYIYKNNYFNYYISNISSNNL